MSEAIEIQGTTKITEPGAYRMSNRVYQRDPCHVPSLSSSIGKLLVDPTKAPRHAWFKHPRLNPPYKPGPSKKNLELGSACHALLLGEGDPIIRIDAKNYQTKAAREERDAASEDGEIPILEHEHERAKVIVACAKEQIAADKEIAWLLDATGDVEVTIAADWGAFWTRARLDWWSKDRLTVVDFKLTGTSASPAGFSKQIANMAYDFQDAFYLSTINGAFPDLAGRVRFVFLVQEWDEPYLLSAMEVSEADRTVASRKVDAAFNLWERCMKEKEWPGYPRGIQRATLPDWHHKPWLQRELDAEGDEGETDWIFAGRNR